MTDDEATSALSLGLMLPELMRAMDSLLAEQVQQAPDIESLRALLREHEAAARERRTFWQRVAALFDPELRTGDVQVRFTAVGQIVVAGYVQAWRFQQPALLVFAPRARSVELELDFVKGRLGRLPARYGRSIYWDGTPPRSSCGAPLRRDLQPHGRKRPPHVGGGRHAIAPWPAAPPSRPAARPRGGAHLTRTPPHRTPAAVRESRTGALWVAFAMSRRYSTPRNATITNSTSTRQ